MTLYRGYIIDTHKKEENRYIYVIKSDICYIESAFAYQTRELAIIKAEYIINKMIEQNY